MKIIHPRPAQRKEPQNVSGKPKRGRKMTIKILNSAPISGQNPEYSFGDRFNFPLWVEFVSQTGDTWYGCFAKMYDYAFSTALIDNDGQTAFIVAGGQGFLIDTTDKKIIWTTEDYPAIESAIKTNNPEYYIAGMFYCAYVIDTKGEIKNIEPSFTTDGIFFTGQKDNKAIGLLNAPMNQYESKYDFEFDLETFHFSINENDKPNFWSKFLENNGQPLTAVLRYAGSLLHWQI